MTTLVLDTRPYGEPGAVAITAVPAAGDQAVSASTAARIEAATPDNTKRAYTRQWAAYQAWCAEHGRTALPATPETLAEYVSHLADRGLAPSTVEQAISTVRRAHRDAGYAGQPDTRGARLVLRSHRRDQAEQGRQARQAPPAAVGQLRAMVEATDPDTTAGLRDRCLLVLGFSLMGRRSELVGLRIDDVLDVEEGIVVRIRKSKTDRDAVGVDVAIPYGSHAETCPVRTVRAWREKLAERGATSGPLLRSVNRHGNIGDTLSGDGLRRIVKNAADRAGLPNADAYSAHSLRAGGATAAAKAGVPAAIIARHGRWSPTSPVVHAYVRQVDRWKDNPMAAVGL